MEEVIFLLLTIAIELPLVLGFLCREPAWRLVLVTVCVNMVTHPMAWQLIGRGFNWGLIEFLVFGFETLVFALIFRSSRVKATAVAIGMNTATALIGFLLF